jgi:hypothetical protein
VDDNTHVRILKYKGKNGSLAQSETDMFRPELVTPTGVKSLASFMSSGGYTDRKYAVDIAREWQHLLGLGDIRDAEEKVKTVETRVIEYAGYPTVEPKFTNANYSIAFQGTLSPCGLCDGTIDSRYGFCNVPTCDNSDPRFKEV